MMAGGREKAMSDVIDLRKARFDARVRKGFRNWKTRFHEAFGTETRLADLSMETLSFLSFANDKGTFYIYDLVMQIQEQGSGFEFHELGPNQKMQVMDRYLFILDRIRFEVMKRLGWLEAYPGEDIPLVELISDFEKLAPDLQARIPALSYQHPDYDAFCSISTLDKEAFIRKLIPKALEEARHYSETT
jgi:hypothetical protein